MKHRATGSPPPRPETTLRFGAQGRFELQPAERRLLVDGQVATLGARAFDLLLTLAALPDRLMSKGELLESVWPGLVVEEANLQVQVANLRKLLGADIIQTVPGQGYRFVGAVQAHPPAAPPAATRLFGRDADRGALLARLRAGTGCVTLVGTSGVGKTSLARAVAAGWPGPTVWVDLAMLTQSEQVVPALARALGTSLDDGVAAPQLLRALQTRDRGQGQGPEQRLLLVLDNAEHLVDTCAELATMLHAVAGVQLLVTSQLPLAVPAEQLVRLRPLALPESPDAHEPADDALALLVERIVAADQRFTVGPAAWPLLHAICVQLDGLPLALEMAAARVSLLGLQGVHDALSERFALLTRGHRNAASRHRTLHQALDWSYQLLGPKEQHLFRALGVFAGGFTLELAVAVMIDGAHTRWDTIEQLGTLVERSLVVASTDDPPRYRLLETMRAYALEQRGLADASDELQHAHRRHAEAMLALFTRYQPTDAVTKALCEAEMNNARVAIQWTQAHDLGLAAQLTALVAPVGSFSPWRHESMQWLCALEGPMGEADGRALPMAVQAAWWTEFARARSIRRDPRAAVAAQRALALWDAAGDTRRALFAACVNVRSVCRPGPELDNACAELQARLDAAPELTLRERLQVQGAFVVAATEREDLPAIVSGRLAEMALARQMGLDAMADGAESNVVFALNAMGRYAEAAERGLALLQRVDASTGNTKGNMPWVLLGLLTALVGLGQLDAAHKLVPRAWAACQQFGAPVVAPTVALLAALCRDFETAARLIGHARAAFAAHEMGLGESDENQFEQVRILASAELDAPAFDRLVDDGRQLDGAAALALALAVRK